MIDPVLSALSATPQPVSALASAAGLSESETQAALQRLVADYFTIEDEGAFELTGPLSWFGNFENAVRYYAKRRIIMSVHGENDSHVYVSDIRVKGGRPAGDPLTESVAVFACAKIARDVHPAKGQDAPACAECRKVLEALALL